jgi:hypothetical protein
LAAECGVAAVVIVGVQPPGEFVASLGIAGVEAGIGPFVGQRAVEPLHFSVGLGPVWVGAAMFDVAQGVTKSVRAVAGSVVGQHFPHGDSAFGEPGVGPYPEGGGGLFAFIGEQLGVGQSRVSVQGGV